MQTKMKMTVLEEQSRLYNQKFEALQNERDNHLQLLADRDSELRDVELLIAQREQQAKFESDRENKNMIIEL